MPDTEDTAAVKHTGPCSLRTGNTEYTKAVNCDESCGNVTWGDVIAGIYLCAWEARGGEGLSEKAKTCGNHGGMCWEEQRSRI